MDDFAETVRNGNSLPAIKEYLNARDGFSPNALWNGNVFVLELPIFEGTKNFPEILKLFRDTGKLNWKEVNERAVLGGMYAHPITFEFSALQQAASKAHPSDLKALIDAGANPSQLVADEVAAFNRAPEGALLYKGTLTGRARDSSGAHAEQELATFKTIGYPLPALEQTVRNASQSPAACEQDIRNRHTFQEAIALAKKNQNRLLLVKTWNGILSGEWFRIYATS